MWYSPIFTAEDKMYLYDLNCSQLTAMKEIKIWQQKFVKAQVFPKKEL